MKEEKHKISTIKKRIDAINQLIYEVASGNFDYKLERSEQEDELDGLIGGVNMLGEELKASTVSRDFMESIYRGVVDILFVLKPDFTIERINDATVNDLGFSQEELIHKPFKKVVLRKDHDALSKILDRLKTEPTCHNMEIHLNRKDQGYIPTSASFSTLYDNQKHILGTLVIAKDISILKNSEKELMLAKEHAELANLAKTSFLTNMSHEIRTPLNGILGFIDLLLETHTDETQKYYLNLIKSSGDSLAKLLNDILDLNKVEQGKLNLENIKFRLQSILDTVTPFKFLAEEKGIDFRINFDPALPEFVIGDPSRLSQILRNLLGNALKFTSNGEIVVTFEVESIKNYHLILKGTVLDTGLGVPKNKQKIIFESFTQADNSTTRKYGGSGLGLTITSHLATLMDGDISVESPPKSLGRTSGSAFTFHVALRVSDTGPPRSITLVPSENLRFPRPYSILVVDDNEINLTLAKKVLENLGGQVSVAQNGLEAVQSVEGKSFDCILMDIQMPVMDGYEATKKLRDNNCKIPILALSANAFNEQVEKCLEVGMNSYIRKPFTKKEIFNTIEACLNRTG